MRKNYTCNKCDFNSYSEIDFKRHKRDIHEINTKSTSPQPKKRRPSKAIIEESMEFDDPKEDKFTSKDVTKGTDVFWVDARNMEKDDKDYPKNISNKQDEKVERKENQRNEADKIYNEKVLLKQMNKENEIEREKQQRKNRQKNQKRKLTKKPVKKVMKPYLRELPDAISQLVGEDHVLFPVQGDGACGPQCVADWVFQDPTLGPYVEKKHEYQIGIFGRILLCFPLEDILEIEILLCVKMKMNYSDFYWILKKVLICGGVKKISLLSVASIK